MIVPLSDIIAALESGVSVNSDDAPADVHERGVLKVSCVAHGRFFPQENKRILPSDAHRVSVSARRGDLLVTRANTFELIAACGIVDRDHNNLFLPDKVWRVVLRDPNRDHIPWLNHALNSPGVRSELKRRATGTSGSMKNIPQASFLAITVNRPPYPEQVAIAKVLNAWDNGIRHLSDLIVAKVCIKQGLMQQLLTGKRRFKGSNDEWHTVHLNDVTEESDERNRGRFGIESVMAVTKAAGIIPMRERTIAADIDRYSVVQKDCFAYNPMRLNIGSIARWTGEDDILVSPDYVVFRCKEPNGTGPAINADFLDQYRRSGLWERYVTSSGNGSVRVRIYFSDLGAMKLRLPPLPEQRKIASVLKMADREIDLLRMQLEALKTQKKGLMQKLLTGQLRVTSVPPIT